MAIFEAAARRGGIHFAHSCVISRLFGVAKPRSFFLALLKMAIRRRDDKTVNRLLDADENALAGQIFLGLAHGVRTVVEDARG